MFAWLFGRTRRFHKSDEMFVVQYFARDGYFYIGSFDTPDDRVETHHTLEAVGRAIEESFGFRDNRHLPLFDRVGLGLVELGYQPVRTIGMSREWYFEREPSKIFISITRPSTVAQVYRNGFEFGKRAKSTIDEALQDMHRKEPRNHHE